MERLVKMFNRFVDGFMDFADVGFRYIDIPKYNEKIGHIEGKEVRCSQKKKATA